MSETSEIIEEMAGRLFAELATPDALRAAEAGTWSERDWARVAELGLPLALVPEEADGVGLSWADAARLIGLAGRHAVPLPVAETMLANRLFALGGLALADGPATLAPVHAEDHFTLDRRAAGWHLRGRARRVPWAARAGRIALVADADGASHVVQIDPSATTLHPGFNLAGEPRDDIDLDLTIPDEQAAPLPAGIDSEAVRIWGAALRTAAIAGAAAAILEMTVSYANDRVQFGRPIGKSQAIQQMLAMLAGQVAACAGAAAQAAGGLDTATPLSVAVGKARAGEAVGVITGIAHQTHGAIGFTHEHSLHFQTKRLWSWREEFGNDAHWQRIIGRRMAQGGAEGLWPLIASL